MRQTQKEALFGLKIVLTALSVILLIYSLYFLAFAVYGLLKKRKVYPETDKLLRFAILVPARNEDSVIGDLMDSANSLDYPKDHFDTYVIINNCTDRTEEIAREKGAIVLPCTDPTKNKSDVLRFAFRKLADEPIDAYVVVDADNTMSTSFLREMNKALAVGAPAAQCVRTGRNSKRSWVAGCYEIYYRFQNAFFNHSRSAAGLPASINGSGWAVTKEQINSYGFKTITITEDMEYTILCGLDKKDIAFVDTADSCDEFVSDWRTSWRQRIRWTFGALQCIKTYQGSLLKNAFSGSFVCFDLFMINILVPVTAFGLLLMPFGYFSMSAFLSFPLYLLTSFASFYLSSCLVALLAVLITHGSVKDTWRGILCYPYFLLSWLPLFISCLFRKDISWTPIRKSAGAK